MLWDAHLLYIPLLPGRGRKKSAKSTTEVGSFIHDISLHFRVLRCEIAKKKIMSSSLQMLMLKRAVNKFKGQISDGASSNGTGRSSPQPQPLRERLLTRLTSAKSVPAAGGGGGGVGGALEHQQAGEPAPADAEQGGGGGGGGVGVGGGGVGGRRAGSKWKFVRQKSQQMLNALNGSESAAGDGGAGGGGGAGANIPGSVAAPAAAATTVAAATARTLSSPPSQSPSAVASSMMHDFNLSMSEYRAEIR